jgi:oxygen-independent coproporphyrinogen III oxidase
MFTRLYLHIPFCLQKCPYCAFVSKQAAHGEIDIYVERLLQEMRLAAGRYQTSQPLKSVYLGGGTPSLLSPQQISQLMQQTEKLFGIDCHAEITMEVNPGTIDEERLAGFRQAGINRLSIGVQSFDPDMLKLLGRVHSADQARNAFAAARSAGFNNIGIDLIHSLPGQSMAMWQKELQQAIQLAPQHLSIYGLTIEEETPFAATYQSEDLLPDEDSSADMYEAADKVLTAAGYEHYEIANYARPGFRSQHNSGYWQRDGYLGLGAGAHSFLRCGEYGIRFGNSTYIDQYCKDISTGKLSHQDLHELNREDAMAEFMFLGLRMSDGVTSKAFISKFGADLETIFGKELNKMAQQGLLTLADNRICLTLRGMLLSNQVFSVFLGDLA